jgi:dTDP-4-dehydrorhamnose reductase
MSRRRIVVTGRDGQVARSLRERAGAGKDIDVIALGRPEFDLERPDSVAAILARHRPDLIVSAAAYTAVDQAEAEAPLAMAVNAAAPGEIAGVAALLGIPVIHLSTDYVFDGTKAAPYVESDATAPVSVYGRSKLQGEAAVARYNPDHLILRTAWLYSPFGRNFLKTMLKLAESRDVVRVVGDQVGCPTSTLDLADGIIAIARNLLERDDPALRGVFHLAANGSGSWADFAEEIFRQSRLCGGPWAEVERIPTSVYPTAVRRPANSRLDCARALALHGVTLPHWRDSVAAVVKALCFAPDSGASSA